MTDVSVTLRPPYLCPWEVHKHGVSIQSSINLGATLLQITREWKTAKTWFLARFLIYQSYIVSQILDFIPWMVTIFSFNHMTGESENYFHWWKKKSAFGMLFLNFWLSLIDRGFISCLQSYLRLHSWEQAEGGRWFTFPANGSTFSFNQQREMEVLKLILPRGSLVVKSKTSSVIWARRVNVSSERKEYIKGNARGYPYRGSALHT